VKNKVQYFLKLVCAILVLMLVDGCKTTKNTALHRGWHNMNARYNGYFYSKENMKETFKKLNKQNKDDFSKPIPLFVYPDNIAAKSYFGDFDKTIKKSSSVIQRHAIVNKKTKEEIANACRWIDENYMLIGQAHLYKRDYFSALEVFEYVSKKYPNPEAKYNGMLWMIRTNNEIGSLSLSELTIDELRNAKDFPTDKSYQKQLAMATADFHIKRNDYSPAIKQLTKAIGLTKNKKEKARSLFVLAQLYESTGDTKKAAQFYAMVPGYHPNYEMVFNAQIKRATLIDINNVVDLKTVKKQLLKMLKDAKNIEYKDQIYYTLANISHKENDIPQTISYLNNSVRTSVSNNTQKALSYLKRADIHFEKLDYTKAQADYDSTMSFLPKDFPNYTSIDSKRKNLTVLVTNLRTIALEDSLQRLAKMNETDRNNYIDKLIAKTEEEEQKKEEEKQNELTQLQNQQTANPQQNNTTGTNSSWYFYNQTTVSFGVAEFNKRWGIRKLEDNWRRSEKDQVLVANTADNDDDDDDIIDSAAVATNGANAKKNKNNKKDRAYYLKSIPLTAEAIDKSNTKIVDAYYNAATIYKEQLQNNKKAIETFEELNSRFPDNKHQLSAYYQLYRTFLTMNNTAKAEHYKTLILTNYANTEFAKIIKNPDYAKDIAATKSEVENFYTATYQLYIDGNYAQALSNCQKADSSYSKSALMPQFAFIKALCIGRTQDINSFESALTQITIKYPKEPVKEKAQEMLELIKKQKNPETAILTDTSQIAKYEFKQDGEYYWVAVIENGKGDINKFKIALSDINSQTFSIDQLSITSMFLDATHQMVTVKQFNGKNKAMDYFTFMKSNQFAYTDLVSGTYKTFIISAENYSIFYKSKNIEAYDQFFTQNYK